MVSGLNYLVAAGLCFLAFGNVRDWAAEFARNAGGLKIAFCILVGVAVLYAVRTARGFTGTIARGPRPRSNRAGIAAVELAIVAPLFFAMFAGMLDYGRYVCLCSRAAAIAREGARNGDTLAAEQSAELSGIRGAKITGEHIAAAGNGSARYVCSVQIPLQNTFFLKLTAAASATFDRETVREGVNNGR